MLLDGSVMSIDAQLRAGAASVGVALQDEGYVGSVLRYFLLPLRRFPAAAYLGCCAAGEGGGGGGGGSGGGSRAADLGVRLATSAKKTQCFSKACVTRVLPAQMAAAAASQAAHDAVAMLRSSGNATGGGAADSASRLAALSVESGEVVLGKYRSEVEMAVQHAMLYSMPGASYCARRGYAAPPRRSSPAACRARLLATGGDDDGALARCDVVGLCVPPRHAAGFRLVHALLKKRAFRGESELIAWREPGPELPRY